MDDREEAVAVAKQRMASFRLRQTPSSSSSTSSIVSNASSVKPPVRSHSRNNSRTDFSLQNSSMTESLSSDEPNEHATPVPSSPSPRSRPGSHHRRRSSVSTRRESAEMMGVAPPLETGPDANGDQSELRRLALWTLEGKGRSDNAFIGSFNKVEIPELNTLDAEVTSDATQASKAKPTLSTFGMGSALTGKRDSFGKLLISSSNSLKDQLHTLMEEEEEEEEEKKEEDGVEQLEEQEVDKEETTTPQASTEHFRVESSYTRPTAPLPNRSRPANLTLRPLSLTPDSLPLSGTEGLPTPSPTPSPRMGKLKALVLAPPSPSPARSNASISSASSRRRSLVSPSPPPVDYIQRRQSISTFPNNLPSSALQRKSSISYKRTDSGDYPSASLPTPGPTPTSPLPPLHAALPSFSTSSAGLGPDLDRPLSPTEQAFLFRSHTSLLCRISDLEQAVAGGRVRTSYSTGTGLATGAAFRLDEECNPSKSHERPTSVTSMSTTSESESLPSQPSDEMLQLVSDLKSERDELMRDADGWRTRVSGLEKQICTLTRRVEAERREAWVVRERLGLMEVEKKRIKEDVDRGRLDCRRLEKALRSEEGARTKVEEERDVLAALLKAEQKMREVAEREVESLRMELEQLCARAEQADADLQALLVTPKVEVTMQKPSRRFKSVDSEMSTSSITDVEEIVPVGIRTLKLNAVQEEVEEYHIPRDVTNECGLDSDNDELAHYEDDGDLDDDMFGDDQTSSSFGSFVHSNSHLLRLDLAADDAPPAPLNSFVPSHAKTGSMERGWSFPQSHGQSSFALRDPPKVDHFFECLDALDAVETDEVGVLPTLDSVTAKQFWSGAVQDADNNDGMPPFVLPAQPRKEKDWKEVEAAKLEVVAEEEEEDTSFSFPSFPAPAEKPSSHDTENDPATPRAALSNTLQAPAGTPIKHMKVRKTSTDLAIPGFKPYSGSVPVLKAPPPPRRISSPARDSPTTPTARGAAVVTLKPTSPPTLIPQPTYNSHPSSLTTPPRPRPANAGSTLIPKLSASPKSSSVNMMPTTTGTPTKTPGVPATVTKLTPLFKASPMSMPPVFMPQPKLTSKSVTRSSLLPPKSTMLIPQQTASPAVSPFKQGLTFKLSQQMQSLTSLWSPWSPSSDIGGKTAMVPHADPMSEQRWVTRYVSKKQQLERLRRDLRKGVALTACEHCSSCRDAVIII